MRGIVQQVVSFLLASFRRIVAWSAVCVFVCSCDWYHPMNFVRGELHSAARIDIVLDTQQKLEQLLPRYIEVANAGGYPYSPRKHRSVTLEELYSESFGGSIAALYWQKKPNAKVTGESLMFRGEFTLEGPFDKQRFKREALAEKVILVLQKGSPDSFTKEDWVTYFRFKDEILPRVFPNATISVTKRRHPAVFTDDDILRQIQRETDFEIPEKYLPAIEDTEISE